MQFSISLDKLHLPLVELRKYLESIGYPLANNEELNVPDSVIRLQEGYHLVDVEYYQDHNVYTVERVIYE